MCSLHNRRDAAKVLTKKDHHRTNRYAKTPKEIAMQRRVNGG